MMKKFLSVITVLLAALVLFSFAACGGEQNPDNPGGTVNPGATVTLNKTELTLNEGAEERLTATTDPAGESISFASSDESVITVSVTGLVTAQAAGTATVTVTVESSGNTATCAVTVNAQQLNIPTGADIKRIDENQDFDLFVRDSFPTSRGFTPFFRLCVMCCVSYKRTAPIGKIPVGAVVCIGVFSCSFGRRIVRHQRRIPQSDLKFFSEYVNLFDQKVDHCFRLLFQTVLQVFFNVFFGKLV